MYADVVTDSMRRAISETMRRRGLQEAHNEVHGIDPTTIRKAVTDILAMIRPDRDGAPVPDGDVGGEAGGGLAAARRRRDAPDLGELPDAELDRLIRTLDEEMREAAAELRFEYAARLRDEIKDSGENWPKSAASCGRWLRLLRRSRRRTSRALRLGPRLCRRRRYI